MGCQFYCTSYQPTSSLHTHNGRNCSVAKQVKFKWIKTLATSWDTGFKVTAGFHFTQAWLVLIAFLLNYPIYIKTPSIYSPISLAVSVSHKANGEREMLHANNFYLPILLQLLSIFSILVQETIKSYSSSSITCYIFSNEYHITPVS